MNAERLNEIKVRAEVYADEPEWYIDTDWQIRDNDGLVVANTLDPHLTNLIAHARQDIPDLLAEVERLQADVAEAEEYIETIENQR